MSGKKSVSAAADLIKGRTLTALYLRILVLALITYLLGSKIIYNAPFPKLSYDSVHNASAMATAMGLESRPTYDPAYTRQGHLRTEYANITIPGHGLPLVEVSILLPLLLFWPAHWLARILAIAATAVGVYYLNSFRLAVLLYTDHFYPAFFPQVNQYFVPLGYMGVLVIFFLLYVLLFGRMRQDAGHTA